MIGLSLDSTHLTRAYAAEHALEFPILGFPTRRDRALYRARIVPLVLVIDEDSRVSYSRVGPLTAPAAVDSVLTAALARRPGPAVAAGFRTVP